MNKLLAHAALFTGTTALAWLVLSSAGMAQNAAQLGLAPVGKTLRGPAGPRPMACAACSAMNWTKSNRTVATGYTDFAFGGSTGSTPSRICGVSLFFQSRNTSSYPVTVVVYDARGPRNSGKILAQATASVGPKLQPYFFGFQKPISLPANSGFWISYNQAISVTPPISSTGTKVSHYWFAGSFGWQGPVTTMPWHYQLHCDNAGKASTKTFDTGCPGGKPACRTSTSYNWTATPASQSTTAKKIAIFDSSFSSSTLICGVDFRCASKSGITTVNVSLHEASSSITPGKQIAVTQLKVSSTPGIHSARFPTRALASSAGYFFLVFDQADRLILPTTKTGSAGLHQTYDGKSWSSFLTTHRWSYRWHTAPAPQVPLLSYGSRPLLGTATRVDLARAKQNSAALFLVGASKKTWGSLPLPFLLPNTGSCRLLSSGEVFVPIPTDAAGRASFTIQIPTLKSLVGLEFYNQFIVVDLAANKAGLITSNAGAAMIGSW